MYFRVDVETNIHSSISLKTSCLTSIFLNFLTHTDFVRYRVLLIIFSQYFPQSKAFVSYDNSKSRKFNSICRVNDCAIIKRSKHSHKKWSLAIRDCNVAVAMGVHESHLDTGEKKVWKAIF